MAELNPALRKAIRRAVQRFRPTCPPPNWSQSEWQNELQHEAVLCALQAEQEFEPALGLCLEKFAYDRICAHLKTFTNREWGYQKTVVAFAEDEETGEEWEPVDERSMEAYEQLEARILVEWLQSQLEEREYQLWVWVAEKRSYRWIGKQLGVSHEVVHRRWKRLQAELRALVENRGQKAG